jgi:hypothetical protein
MSSSVTKNACIGHLIKDKIYLPEVLILYTPRCIVYTECIQEVYKVVENGKNSDILTARVPKSVKAQFKAKAAQKGVSVNTLLNHAIDNELREHHGKKVGR